MSLLKKLIRKPYPLFALARNQIRGSWGGGLKNSQAPPSPSLNFSQPTVAQEAPGGMVAPCPCPFPRLTPSPARNDPLRSPRRDDWGGGKG